MFEMIAAERKRQERLKREGKFDATCADPTTVLSNTEKLAVLTEEVGEVARVILDRQVNNKERSRELGPSYEGYDKWRYDGKTRRMLQDELVQVAAVAVAWLEALGSEESGER
jgi:NTP pyrophosphatase (non-canonical NTP hydrolase)